MSESAVQRPRLLTVREIADLLAVPVSWVYSHTGASGDMPHIKVGRYTRFSVGEVMKWARDRDGE